MQILPTLLLGDRSSVGTLLDILHLAIRAAGALYCLQEPGLREWRSLSFLSVSRELLSSRPWQRTVCYCLLSLCSHAGSSSSWELPQEHRELVLGQRLPRRGPHGRALGPCLDRVTPLLPFAHIEFPCMALFHKVLLPKSGNAVIYRQNSSRTTWEGPNARTAVLESERGPKPSHRPGRQASGPIPLWLSPGVAACPANK